LVFLQKLGLTKKNTQNPKSNKKTEKNYNKTHRVGLLKKFLQPWYHVVL